MMRKTIFTFICTALIYFTAVAQDTTRVHQSTTTTYDSTTTITSPKTTTTTTQTTVQNTNPPKSSEPNMGGKLMLGVRYMPTFTSISGYEIPGTGVVETSLVMGYGVGGLIGVTFNNHWALQAEVIYSALAQQYKTGSANPVLNLKYVHIPLMLSYNTGLNQPVNFNIAAGPQFGWNVGSSITGQGNGQLDTVTAKVAVKPADLGVAYGLGLDFGLGPDRNVKISIGYRGVFGLIDISDKSNNVTTNQYYILSRSHVNTYAAYIGLTFLL